MRQQTPCIYGWTKEVCEQECGCQKRMKEPVSIDRVSVYDRTVPRRITVPVCRGATAQRSQIEALRNRIWRYIKSTKGRKAANFFGEVADAILLKEGVIYEERRAHLEYLLNLFLREITTEIEELVKGCS